MKKDAVTEQFEVPALIRPEHEILNPGAAEGLQRFAVRDDSALGKAYRAGRLGVGRHCYTAQDRYTAALKYRALWDTIHRSGGAGGLAERVNSSPKAGSDAQSKVIARELFKQTEEALSVDARFILRAFIGEGSSGSEAVQARIAGIRNETWVFISTRLDELIDAIVRLGLHRFPDVSRETEH